MFENLYIILLGITDPSYHKSSIELEEESIMVLILKVSRSREVDSACLPGKKRLAEKNLLSTKRNLVNTGKLEAYNAILKTGCL